MPRPLRITYAGAKYHVSSRGNGRQVVFRSDEDRLRFIDQLAAAVEKDEVILYAFVLMQNHYHLFVETPLANIKKFMQRLNTAYSMYFRFKHNKPGHCLQGRYAAKLVKGDDYLVRLTRYIHLNPVETREMRKRSLEERRAYLRLYRWSSYPGYVNKALEEELVDYRWLSLMERKTEKGNRAAYRKYVEGMVGKKDEVLHKAVGASRYAIGDEKFIAQTEEDLKGLHLVRACGGGDVYLPRKRVESIDVIEKAVADAYGITADVLHRDGHQAGEAKVVAIELMCRLTGKSQREVGRYFGYTSDSSVSKQRKKCRDLCAGDKKLGDRIEDLKQDILSQYSPFQV